MTTNSLAAASDREKFQAAYQAWKQATEAFEEKMRGILAGGPSPAIGELARDCEELDRLRTTWLRASEPFVGFR